MHVRARREPRDEAEIKHVGANAPHSGSDRAMQPVSALEVKHVEAIDLVRKLLDRGAEGCEAGEQGRLRGQLLFEGSMQQLYGENFSFRPRHARFDAEKNSGLIQTAYLFKGAIAFEHGN